MNIRIDKAQGEYVFWAGIVSPHVGGLARSLVERGSTVTYIASEVMSSQRANEGWSLPKLPGVRVEVINRATSVSKILPTLSGSAIHITQGIRRNGYIAEVIPRLTRQHARWGVMMETVDDRGPMGLAKRVDYAMALRFVGSRLHFVLAIGHRTPGWVARRGVASERIFPFAYFLEEPRAVAARSGTGPYRIGFIGSLVRTKRVDLLVEALGRLTQHRFELVIVGDGPMRSALVAQIDAAGIAHRVTWRGTVSMCEARAEVATLDCLVLPSEAEGWGAVVSEALMAGVPAVCSSVCGSVSAVEASGVGGVFATGSVESLAEVMLSLIVKGPMGRTERHALASWAACLSGPIGAEYLEAITRFLYHGGTRPVAPWVATSGVPAMASSREMA